MDYLFEIFRYQIHTIHATFGSHSNRLPNGLGLCKSCFFIIRLLSVPFEANAFPDVRQRVDITVLREPLNHFNLLVSPQPLGDRGSVLHFLAKDEPDSEGLWQRHYPDGGEQHVLQDRHVVLPAEAASEMRQLPRPVRPHPAPEGNRYSSGVRLSARVRNAVEGGFECTAAAASYKSERFLFAENDGLPEVWGVGQVFKGKPKPVLSVALRQTPSLRGCEVLDLSLPEASLHRAQVAGEAERPSDVHGGPQGPL